MERDSLTLDTPVSLSDGISIQIGEMKDVKYLSLYGWDSKKNKLVIAEEIDYITKQHQHECFELTFNDGRKTTYTAGHPVMTKDGKWIEVKDIVVNETKIKAGPDYVLVDFKEMEESNNYSEILKTLDMNINTKCDYLNTLSFIRMMGYMLSKNNYHGGSSNYIYFTNGMDIETMFKDISLFSEGSIYGNCENMEILKSPIKLSKKINELIDKNGNQNILLSKHIPLFLWTAPIPIVREFLGGIIGGNCRIEMNEKDELVLRFIVDSNKIENNIPEIATLLMKCGINIISQGGQNIIVNLYDFHTKIGIRYNCIESLKLAVMASYIRAKNNKLFDGTVDEYLEKIEMKTFMENPSEDIQTMMLTVINKVPVGLKTVCDIEVNSTNSFLANGIVSHNCIISHGGAYTLRDRLFYNGDKFSTFICNNCGHFAIADSTLNSYHCQLCGIDEKIFNIQIPYACKLLFQELMAMGISVKIRVNEHKQISYSI